MRRGFSGRGGGGCMNRGMKMRMSQGCHRQMGYRNFGGFQGNCFFEESQTEREFLENQKVFLQERLEYLEKKLEEL